MGFYPSEWNERWNCSYFVCSLLRLKINPFRFPRLNYIIVWHCGGWKLLWVGREAKGLVPLFNTHVGLMYSSLLPLGHKLSPSFFESTELHNMTITFNSEKSILIWGYINFEVHSFNLRLNSLEKNVFFFVCFFLDFFPAKSEHSDKYIDSKFWKPCIFNSLHCFENQLIVFNTIISCLKCN